MTTQEKKVGSVLDNFLKPTKSVAMQKEKTTLLNLRIPEKLRDDFQMYCFEKSRRTGKKTDMSKEIITYIRDCLENL